MKTVFFFSKTLKANQKNCTNIVEGSIKIFGNGFLGTDGNREAQDFFTSYSSCHVGSCRRRAALQWLGVRSRSYP